MQRIEGVDCLTRIRYAGINAINRMQEYFLVDTTGVVFHLGEVRIKGKPGWIRGAVLRVLNPIVEVKYDNISLGAEMDSRAIRDRMLKEIQDDYGFWSDVVDVEAFINRINQCNTIPELIAVRGQVGAGEGSEDAPRMN